MCAPVRTALDHLRSVLLSDLLGSLDRAPLTDALRDLSASAHENGLQPEQLVICFKEVILAIEAWSRVPESRAERLQQQLVTRCIEAYFARAGDGASGRD